MGKSLKIQQGLRKKKKKLKVKKKKDKEKEKVVPGRMTFPASPHLFIPPLPFPQRFRKAKLDENFAEFLNMFKKLEVKILFAEAFTQLPNYVKFMKEIMSNKKKLDAYDHFRFPNLIFPIYGEKKWYFIIPSQVCFT